MQDPEGRDFYVSAIFELFLTRYFPGPIQCEVAFLDSTAAHRSFRNGRQGGELG